MIAISQAAVDEFLRHDIEVIDPNMSVEFHKTAEGLCNAIGVPLYLMFWQFYRLKTREEHPNE